ncbi:MAG: hypothetical protein FMNOHCHN_02681 [Ignavibacteriaceae bacterium]|nr:hypothetical protein [Ignavibacteriaceae bacterium]
MNFSLFHRITAAVVFVISTLVLLFTVQPSVSFWDCGEFIAAAYYLQVPHPPGTPFFLLVGKIVSMIPFAENIAYRVNMVSVFSSSLSVLFLYLVVVKLIRNYKKAEPANLWEALGTYIPAAIGALSFSFSDTFWFNGVEAEVYALSTVLFAAIAYLMLRWNERADEKDNEKYILLIALLIGFSTGVHLMSVLAIIAVVMVIMFRKYVTDDEMAKRSGYFLLIHIGIALLFAFIMWGGEKSSTPPDIEQYKAFDSKFVTFIGLLSLVFIGINYKRLVNLSSYYILLILGGLALVVTYPGVVKIMPNMLKNIAGNNINTALIIIALVMAGLAGFVYYTVKNNKPTLHLVGMSLILIILGFSTYTMVKVRANQDPPMNENEPKDFTELVSYLNREQYGDFPTFKRRFATEPHQMVVYDNYSSDLDFWWRYQMNHMMTRYWLWNYVGRESWNQDSGVNAWPFNGLANIIGKPFSISFAGEAKDSLFGIPLLIGLLGIYFHFRRDWKMASVFMVLFIFMGYLTAFYQNQQQPQPRERDYFYVGAFFVFSVWIGLGIRGLIEIIHDKMKSAELKPAIVGAVLLFGIVFVPGRMLQANYYTHDRSNNWVPWDYSYNLLQSCEPNAILFTNGDNDTFPLWYLQDVEGVRRDVRIVNLSLLNTPWYIRQLKHLEPYGSAVVKMKISDMGIQQIRPIIWKGVDLNVPVPAHVYQEFGVTDTSIINQGRISFRMNPTINAGEVQAVRVQDLMTRDIIESFGWERPVYFAVTCTEDSKIGLGDYLRMEGMAMRLVPYKRTPGVEFVNEEVLRAQIFDSNEEEFSKDFRPGMKFRGINDESVFFDENHTRLSQNYRNAFIRLALYYQNTNRMDESIKVLDEMERKIPRKRMPMDYRLQFDLSGLYMVAGAMDKYKEYAGEVEAEALKRKEGSAMDMGNPYNSYRILLEIYTNMKDYDKSIALLKELQAYYPNDPSLKSQIEMYEGLKATTAIQDTSR